MKSQINRQPNSRPGISPLNRIGLITFAAASLLVAGPILPTAQDKGPSKNYVTDRVTMHDPKVPVNIGDTVGMLDVRYNMSSRTVARTITWTLTAVDSNGVTLVYHLDGIFGSDTLKMRDTVAVEFGQENIVGAYEDSLVIHATKVKVPGKGPQPKSVSINAAILR
jgi:hypothetical protein